MSNIKKGSKLTVSTANGISRATTTSLGVLEVSGPKMSDVTNAYNSNPAHFVVGATDVSGILQVGINNDGNTFIDASVDNNHKDIILQKYGGNTIFGSGSNSTAKVGIGTNNPDATLEVRKDSFTSSGLGSSTVWTNNDESHLKITGDNNCMVFRVNTIDNNRNALIQVGHRDDSYHKGSLFLNPYGGNVGINTTNASGGALHVVGNIYSTGKILGEVGGSNLIVGGTTYQSATAPTNGMLVEGNVGIGTTSPNGTLNVYKSGNGEGMVQITGTSDMSLRLQCIRTDSNDMEVYYEIMPGTTTTNSWKMGTNDDKNLHFAWGNISSMNNQEIVTILNTGNVGIGTTDPKNKLDVEGAAVIGATYSGTNTAPTNGLLVEGNVGIGTTVPNERLHVIGNAVFQQPSSSSSYTSNSTHGINLIPYGGDSGGNTGGRIFFDETINGQQNYGFTLGYNGGGDSAILNWKSNTFNINRHNNSDNGLKVISIDRDTSEFNSNGVQIFSDHPTSSTDNNLGTILSFRSPYISGIKEEGGFKFVMDDTNDGTAIYPRLSINAFQGSGVLWEPNAMTFKTTSSTNVNVGIGTTDPGNYKLNVNGTIYASGSITSSVGIFLGAGYKLSWSPHGYIEGNNSYINFATWGVRRMSILDGNVGIGTTVPKNKLDVEGAAVIGATYSGTNTAPTNGLLVEGNVGIGTTSPYSKLHVTSSIDGDVWTTGTTAGDCHMLIGGYEWGTQGTNEALKIGLGHVDNATANVPMYIGCRIITSANDTTSALVFGTRNSHLDTTAAEERMCILPSGNVGIGTTSPGAKLHIKGGDLRIERPYTQAPRIELIRNNSSDDFGGDQNQDWAIQNSSGGKFQIISGHSTNGDTIVLSSDGTNVGIGTTNPNAPLHIFSKEGEPTNHIKDMIKIETEYNDFTGSNREGGASILFYVENSEVSGDGQGFPGEAARIVAGCDELSNTNEYYSYLAFHTSNNSSSTGTTEQMVIRHNGNVGIGVANPSDRLVVNTASAETKVQFGIGGNNYSTVMYIGGASGDQRKLALISDPEVGWCKSNLHFCLNTVDGYDDATLSDSKMVIKNNGNVGIGTTSMFTKLDVNGTTSTQGLQIMSTDISSNTSTRPAIAIRTSTVGIQDYEIATIPNFYTNRASNHGSNSGFLRIRAGGGTNANSTSYIDLTGYSKVSDMDQNIVFGTRGAERMRINSSGNVGIGTTSPDSKLHVNGNITLDACRTGSSYPTGSVGGGISFRAGASYAPDSSNGAYNCSILTYAHDQTTDGLSINGYDGVSFCTGSSTRNERMRINSSGNVGIGTTNPTEAKLVVNGSSIIGIYSMGDYTYYNYILNAPRPGYTTGGAVHFINSDTRTIEGGAACYNIRNDSGPIILGRTDFGTTIKGSNIILDGNVGIGTTSPYSKLEIKGDDYTGDPTNHVSYLLRLTQEYTEDFDTSSPEGGVGMKFLLDNQNNNSWAVGEIYCYCSNNDNTEGDSSLRFRVSDQSTNGGRSESTQGANVDAMTIHHSGNVGIGTTNPSEKVWIQSGNLALYSNSTSSSNAAGNSNILLDVNSSPNTTANGIKWKPIYNAGGNDYTGRNFSAAVLFQPEGAYFKGGLAFYTHGFDSTSQDATEKMRINRLGNVGIGTTDPKNKLDVEGAAVIGATYSGTNTAPANGLLVEGNVGFGTTVPKNKLDVEGAAVIGATYSGTNTAPANGLLVEGNVGIGTTIPQAKLDVNGTAKFANCTWTQNNGTFGSVILTGKQDGGYWGIQLGDDTNAPKLMCDGDHFGLYFDGPGEWGMYSTVNAATQLAYNGSTKLKTMNDGTAINGNLSVDGHIGINTTSYTQPLVINDTTNMPNASYSLLFGSRNWDWYGISTQNWYSHAGGNHRPLSVYSQGGIWIGSGAYFASSDRRIKMNIVDVSDNQALEMIRNIPCRYYEYKDKISRGIGNTIGFIAQEVREVMPMAINLETGIIPSEGRNLIDISWNGSTLYSDLSDCSGVKYRFYVGNDLSSNDIMKDVVGNSDNSFTFDQSWNYVFCYGKEVDDFHTVDKNKLFALNFSATQEIDRIQQQEITKVQTLQTDISNANTIIQTHEATIQQQATTIQEQATTIQEQATTIQEQATKITTLETQIADILTRLSNLENSS